MVTEYISDCCLALLLEEGDEVPDPAEVIRKALKDAGLPPWDGAVAELYTASGKRLLLARPRPPLRQRGNAPRRRLY